MPVVKLDDGTVAIVCTRGAAKAPALCEFCAKIHTKLCDFPVWGKTCDKRMCDEHATEVGPDKDYCPPHAKESGGKPVGAQ